MYLQRPEAGHKVAKTLHLLTFKNICFLKSASLLCIRKNMLPLLYKIYHPSYFTSLGKVLYFFCILCTSMEFKPTVKKIILFSILK